jgi:hypothetical protein
MYRHITSPSSCAAVFAVGEQMAASRFRVIAGCSNTPSDIMGFLKQALPDETYHAKAFAALAHPEDMQVAFDQHRIAVGLLIPPA